MTPADIADELERRLLSRHRETRARECWLIWLSLLLGCAVGYICGVVW